MDDWFIKLPQLLGVVPLQIHRKFKLLRISQALLTLSAWIAIVCYLLWLDTVEHGRIAGDPGLFIMQVSVSMLCFIINAGVVARLYLFQHDQFAELQLHFQEIKSMLHGNIPRQRYECIELKVMIIFGVDLFLEYMELCIWNKHGFEWRSLLNTASHMNILLINAVNWSILRGIHKRLEDLNVLVAQFSEEAKEKGSSFRWIEVVGRDGSTMKTNKPKYEILQWNRLHLVINKISSLYNDLFGWHVFVMMLYAMLLLLALIKEFLDFGMRFNLDYLNIIALTLYRIIEMIVIVSKCDEVSKESKRTTLLAYDASANCISSVNRKEIVRFAHQSGVQYIQFSAAGFFDIDNSVLFIMLQLLTTYVIVLVQFEH